MYTGLYLFDLMATYATCVGKMGILTANHTGTHINIAHSLMQEHMDVYTFANTKWFRCSPSGALRNRPRSHFQYVTLTVQPLIQDPLLRSFSLSIPLRAAVIVHAAEKEGLKPHGNFESVLLPLAGLGTTHHLPDASRPT